MCGVERAYPIYLQYHATTHGVCTVYGMVCGQCTPLRNTVTMLSGYLHSHVCTPIRRVCSVQCREGTANTTTYHHVITRCVCPVARLVWAWVWGVCSTCIATCVPLYGGCAACSAERIQALHQAYPRLSRMACAVCKHGVTPADGVTCTCIATCAPL